MFHSVPLIHIFEWTLQKFFTHPTVHVTPLQRYGCRIESAPRRSAPTSLNILYIYVDAKRASARHRLRTYSMSKELFYNTEIKWLHINNIFTIPNWKIPCSLSEARSISTQTALNNFNPQNPQRSKRVQPLMYKTGQQTGPGYSDISRICETSS